MVLTCQVVSPWPCSCECKGPCPRGSTARAAHVTLASVSTKVCLLLAWSKQEGSNFLFTNFSLKEVKTSGGCCQEIVLVQEKICAFFVCYYLLFSNVCTGRALRDGNVFLNKSTILWEVLGYVTELLVIDDIRRVNIRSCGCAFTFSPNENLSLQISAIIY